MDGLLDPAAAALLEAVRSGTDAARRLRVGDLAPGDVGVLDAEVVQVGAVRTYNRRRGGEGLLCRVTLRDATGEVELVLWDESTRLARDGPFRPGALLRLKGPTVREGYRGGVELHLGACVVEPLVGTPAPPLRLVGRLAALAPTHVVGTPPRVRFNAEATLETAAGAVQVVLWDEVLRAARQVLPGAAVVVEGAVPHPALEGWFVADGGARLRVA